MGPIPSSAAEPPASSAQETHFEQKIRPLLVRRCHECHSAQAKILKGGLRLDSRAGLAAGGDSGPAVLPGRAEESLLIRALRHGGEVEMPPTGKLPAAEIEEFVRWVNLGAFFPAGEPAATKPARVIDIEAGRNFWSFQPVNVLTPPPTALPDWTERPVDRWLLAAMGREGLVPSPPADRRTLIRRASFDLLGLPPSADEVEAFIADQETDAWPRLIDRLLASPHYGERWGRYWLDLVRYTDRTPNWLTSADRGWLYRDWVVAALNRDVPYDRFVALQLAADQVEGAEPADIAALGFIGLSPTHWKELQLDKELIKVIVADEWDERVDMVSRALLGLTVACARCHDHKFDPVTTDDYYALAGVFASTRLIDRPLLPPDQAPAVAAARAEAEKLTEQRKKLLAATPVPPAAQQEADALAARIEKLRRDTPHFDAPLAHAVDDASLFVLADGPSRTKLEYRPGEPRDLGIFVRGNPAQEGPAVPRHFPAVLSPEKPAPFRSGSGRRELAEAIFRDAGPLAARVIVNRVWKHHFGRGLVETSSDFGVQGSRPSHPELLDDLAACFIAAGWSLKWLHREILLSAAWQQLSVHDAGKAGVDPDNRWLWRMNRTRLDLEAWRDAVLSASGQLDVSSGGPSREIDDPANRRRTLYVTVARQELHAMLRIYDFPDPAAHSPDRDVTTTPLQQLFVLNSQFMEGQAGALAARLAVPAGAMGGGDAGGALEPKVQQAYRLVVARPATPTEVRAAIEFLTDGNASTAPDAARWQQYAQALLSLNELMFVD